MSILFQSVIWAALFLAASPAASAQANAKDDFVIRVGTSGLTHEELLLYQSKRLEDLRHNQLSGIDWGTKDIQVRQAIEDEIVFQEALQAGIHREGKIRDAILEVYHAHQAVSKIHPQAFSEDQIRNFYENHKSEFMLPAEFEFKMLTVPSASSDIQSLYQQVKENPMAVMAWQNAGRRRFGDSFNLPITQEDTASIYRLRMDQISEPIISSTGVGFIFWCTYYQDPVEKPLEDVREEVLLRMVEDREASDQIQNAGEADNTAFEEALKAGVHRDRYIRDQIITTFLRQTGSSLASIVHAVKGRYSVEILSETSVE